MGVMMKKQLIKYLLLFSFLPLLLWALGDFHRGTVLKEALSVLVILSFFLIIGQLFLSRGNGDVFKESKMARVTKFHKIIGYTATAVIMLHPFFIVIPRFFEAGLKPEDAFITLITNFESLGVIFGIVAWTLMMIIGFTSFFRDKTGMSYKNWRVLHGMLSIIFITVASFHMIDLGSHINTLFVATIVALASYGILITINLYILKPNKITQPDE